MPTSRRIGSGLAVAAGLTAAALAALLVVPAGAGAGPLEFSGVGRSTTAPAAAETDLGTPAAPSGAPSAGAARAAGTVTVSGSVAGLYPGVTLPLVLTVTNAVSRSVTVTTITTSVANASKRCRKANLIVSPFTGGAVVIAPGGQAVVTVQATMSLQAGNACQGAAFGLTYHGRATTR